MTTMMMMMSLLDKEDGAESSVMTCESLKSMALPMMFRPYIKWRRESDEEDGAESSCVSLKFVAAPATSPTHTQSSKRRRRRSEAQKKKQGGERSRTRPGPQRPVFTQHKIRLRSRFECVTEGVSKTERRRRTRLNSIFTALYITEGPSEEVNTQHEVRQLETTSKTKTRVHETPIQFHDIFKVLSEQGGPIRVVLTNGVAGVGKTFLVQKFTLDWAEGLENQDVNLVIPLSFRELNLIRDQQHSLLTLLHVFHPTLEKVRAEKLAVCKPLFILDGLDESRLSLDFSSRTLVSDVTHRSSVNELLKNLIQGNLLPSALVWITSRPAAANQIPPTCVDRVTEVRGFTDDQKDEYFRKRSRTEELSSRIISHIKTSRSLHIMCQIPVFCWISATVLEHMLTSEQRAELPRTLTDLYSHFLLVQTKWKKIKYDEESETSPWELMEADRDVLLKLGRLAFEHLQKGDIMFYQEDLEQCGLDATEALVKSGVCTEIFKRESVIFQKSVYCFVHLSVQEFLAAVYIFHCHLNKDNQTLEDFLGSPWSRFRSCDPSLDVLLRRAVEESLKSTNGHLDLFVRFLHGLSVASNQRLLRGLLGRVEDSPESNQNAIFNLKQMSSYTVSPDRSINLYHCLLEMNDHSVHRESQRYLRSASKTELHEIHCSALAFLLQISPEVQGVLDVNGHAVSEEARLRLIPAVRNCRAARLSGCRLTDAHCGIVAAALNSDPSHLRKLDLSDNTLQESGVRLLSTGLQSPNCTLQTLRLLECGLTDNSCSVLASALESVSCRLTELDLSNNKLRDAGAERLSAALESPTCPLETLSLRHCSLSERCCVALASLLESSGAPCLKELDLSYNDLQDSGVGLLCVGLESPNCGLETLRLSFCGLTEQSCGFLASALASNPSHLRDLDLSDNQLQGSAATPLSVKVDNPNYRLHTLKLR